MGVEDTKNPVDKEIIEANPVKTEITQEELLHSLPHEIELMELKELATIAVEITKDTLDEVSAHNPTKTSLNHGCLRLTIQPPNGLQPDISSPVGKVVGDDPLAREVILVDINITDNVEPDVNKLDIIKE